MDSLQSNTTKNYVIYIIQNMIDNQCYVGMTKDCKRRWRTHQVNSCNEHLRNAIAKYGVESFEFSIVERWETVEQAYEAERDIILYLRFLGTSLYNSNDGGLGGCTPNDATIEKIRVAYRRDEKTLCKRGESIRHTKADPIRRKYYSDLARIVNNTKERRLQHRDNAIRLWSSTLYRKKQADAVNHELRSINAQRIHNDESIKQRKCVKMSSLTEEQARMILFELSDMSIQELSIQFNVSYKVIHSLLTRKTWKHLT